MGKYSLNLLVLFVLLSTYSFADMKRYLVKSGEVQYKIVGNGSMMGLSTDLEGDSFLYFKDYGATEITKEKIIQNVMGQKETENETTKFENGMVYSVDFEDKVIYKQKIPIDIEDPMLQNKGEESLKSLGAKKIGSYEIAGFTCDKWELHGTKMCIYKGVPLKMETSTMGTDYVQIATNARFDINIDEEKFNLPDYPIKSLADIKAQREEQMRNQMQNMSPEEKKMMQDMMKNMGDMFGSEK